eukprot:1156943-Pelagomonas_calceolata.AAC.7
MQEAIALSPAHYNSRMYVYHMNEHRDAYKRKEKQDFAVPVWPHASRSPVLKGRATPHRPRGRASKEVCSSEYMACAHRYV